MLELIKVGINHYVILDFGPMNGESMTFEGTLEDVYLQLMDLDIPEKDIISLFAAANDSTNNQQLHSFRKAC